MLAYAILFLGILSRLLVHVPNFTPVIAIALFSGAYVPRRWAVVLPLGVMLATDMILGFHSVIFFTWGSIALISMIGLCLREKRTPVMMIASSMASALLFFVVTNFGTWLVAGLYPMTVAGLKECFVLAIPFFRMSLLATIVYSLLFTFCYNLIESRIRKTRFAFALCD